MATCESSEVNAAPTTVPPGAGEGAENLVPNPGLFQGHAPNSDDGPHATTELLFDDHAKVTG